MSLRIGIVGLPNVGKSTLFNALTRAQNAAAENYPFCTIEPNKAIVPVPDSRLEMLQKLVEVPEAIPTTIEFVDVAGLVKGASQGEGLGNQFLGHIRDVDAVLHVVRCFEDSNVSHVHGTPDPQTDIDVINLELALADMQQLERKIEKLERQVKGDADLKPVLALAQTLKERLERGEPIWTFPDRDGEAFKTLNAEMRFLTAKPVVYVINTGEEAPDETGPCVEAAERIAAQQGAEAVRLSIRLEQEMTTLDDEERDEYLALYGLSESGLEKVIQRSYAALGLISFFTFNDNEVRAWTVRDGWTAPQAAGVIHTDFEQGFIKAEVIGYDTFVAHGSRAAVRAAGAMGIEGRDYLVKDGDVILFRFNT